MLTAPVAKIILKVLLSTVLLYSVMVLLFYWGQRSLIYFPTHSNSTSSLQPWSDGNMTIGYCWEVVEPETLWLMMHGNAGQAANRDYVLPCMSPRDSLYVLEYPGYGLRPGKPSRQSIDGAASAAYRWLRSHHPGKPVCILSESIGGGPACELAKEEIAPDKIVLVVPFDSLANVAAKMFPFLPVRRMLRDSWDNVESLRHYKGPVEIFAAIDDEIIPVERARALAQQTPGARLREIRSRHNDWVDSGQVRIRR